MLNGRTLTKPLPRVPAPVVIVVRPAPLDLTRLPVGKTRLLKCRCRVCGYTVRVTRKWLRVAVPSCPVHRAMTVEV